MATYTRQQLRSRQTSSADFTAQAYTFTIKNNVDTTAYFNIEGGRIPTNQLGARKPIFFSASLSSLVNCSVISETQHAGFIINPNSTASFDFTPTSTIAKADMEYFAANTLVYSIEDITSSGSAFGVDLAIAP